MPGIRGLLAGKLGVRFLTDRSEPNTMPHRSGMFSFEKFVVTPQWEILLREHGLVSIEAVYNFDAGTVLKRSGSNEVRCVRLGPKGHERVVFIKKYWIGRSSQIWSGFFRGVVFGVPKARREFQNLRRLRDWGLDAPAPVAFGEERRQGAIRRTFLMSEAVPDAAPLHQVIARWLPTQPPAVQRTWRAELTTRLAGYTRRMHDHRFVHHDYFWRNIILSGSSLDHFPLIDSHKGKIWAPGQGRRSRAKDLATLDAAAPAFFRRTERLRFFLNYVEHKHLTRDDKSMIRGVLHLAEPMRERQSKRVFES